MSTTTTSTQAGGGSSSRAALLAAAQAFCDAFAAKSTPPAELVSKFFASSSSPEILALEHGLANHPALAAKLPFLGTPFRGAAGVQSYFEAVGGALDYSDMRFSFSRQGDGGAGIVADAEEKEFGAYSPFVVDVEGRQVCVKGKGRFRSRETGQEWDESFIYKLGYTFEEEEQGARGGWKVVRFEVWADPAAAYLATKGEL
ncbi:hypothetical protein Micbo1qcDRAFT_156531 [Microdochium bolleyi]|uniref:SnoaL-like domain-containing protein n=1 Tax=Microdochium bolleyi TaxID=196109 RepID=A0A136JKA9_9PEZI|nr:hypothetical protein Micbo1qcDRAFT_156531 [Microdochium bolleyi]